MLPWNVDGLGKGKDKRSFFDDKIVLVTGGTGSLGSAIARELLGRGRPREVRILSRNESRQVELQQTMGDDRARFYIGAVENMMSLRRAMAGVNVVMHAAAMKHVPLCETHPFEAIETNVLGTMNVIRAAIEGDVELVVGVSTDKAVYPLSVYGGTKLLCERLLVRAADYDPERRTRFACLRFGNLAGSSGSVVHLFQEQGRRGAVRITDARMTRFWMTPEQAAAFTFDAVAECCGGEVFVPKLPSVRIIEVAEAVAPHARKLFVGARPGEKLHETLVTEEESKRVIEKDDRFVIYPPEGAAEERAVAAEPVKRVARRRAFRYSSDSNSWWLTGEQLLGVIHAPRRAAIA